MNKYSKNAKLNNLLLNIEGQLLSIQDTPEESLNEIKSYACSFNSEIDYNLAQYGNLLVYYSEVREFYTKMGYKFDKYSDLKVWEIYKKQVGFVANQLIKSHESK